MFNLHPFGLAGGAGSVDDVREIVRPARCAERDGLGCRDILYINDGDAGMRAAFNATFAEQHAHAGMLNHVVESLRRISRIERHERRTGTPHTEQDSDQVCAALKHYPDQRYRAKMLVTQLLCDGAGASPQLRVAQGLRRALHRDLVRRRQHAALEQLVNAQVGFVLERARIEHGIHHRGLLRRDQRQALQRSIGSRHD